MARVRFTPLPPIVNAKETHRVGPNKVWDVFMGWAQVAGGEWNKRYLCAALTEFVGMDLRVGGYVRVQEVYEDDVDETGVFFSLKNMYYRANGALEGSSAPYGTIGSVAPQGLSDLGTTEDTGPVGSTLGEVDNSAVPQGVVPDDVPQDADEDAHLPREFDPSMPGPAVMLDQPLVRASAPPADTSHIPTERPDDLPDGDPWPYPDHWTVRPDAQRVIHRAEPFYRPDGTHHPDVFNIPSMKSTIVRRRLTRQYMGTARAPDVISTFGLVHLG